MLYLWVEAEGMKQPGMGFTGSKNQEINFFVLYSSQASMPRAGFDWDVRDLPQRVHISHCRCRTRSTCAVPGDANATNAVMVALSFQGLCWVASMQGAAHPIERGASSLVATSNKPFICFRLWSIE